MNTSFRVLVSALVVIAAAVSPAFAQATGGSLSGTVKDATGGVLPGVAVLVTNVDTSLTRTVVTDAGGRYVASDLPPGPYSVKGSLEGFTSVVRKGITLTVGRDAVVDLELTLGQVSDQVTVVGEAAAREARAEATRADARRPAAAVGT